MIRYFLAILHQLTRIADAFEEQNAISADWIDYQKEHEMVNTLEEPYYKRALKLATIQKETAEATRVSFQLRRDLSWGKQEQSTAPLPDGETKA